VAEGLDRESAYDEDRNTAVRRTAVTIRGEGVAPCEDSLFGEDESSSKGPEWCVDTGSEIQAMNKFELWLALGAGDFSPTILVWKVGRERWQPAVQIPELACALRLHAQTLLAAERFAREAQAEIPTQASTPQAPTTDEASPDDVDALGDTLIATPEPMAPLTGMALSDRPEEPAYIVRGPRPRRRTDVRVQLISGLTAVGALAATLLLVAAGRSRIAPVATPISAEAAGMFSLPEGAIATPGQAAEAPPSMKTDLVDPPKVEPARHSKSVSPTHRGQERAHRKSGSR
jgi:hypothetical protein